MNDTTQSKYAPVPGNIPGRLVNMGGVMLVFAPLSLDQVHELEPVMEKFGKATTLRDNVEESLPILLASLQRNYPDMTREQLEPLVDVSNFKEAVEAAVGFGMSASTLA